MAAVAHAAWLGLRANPKDPQSLTNRQVHEQLRDSARARKTIDHTAEATLEEPDYPAWIHYLRVWSGELYGRSGMGMEGVSPLTWATLHYWTLHSGRDPEPHEIDALFTLDAIQRNPDAFRKQQRAAQREAESAALTASKMRMTREQRRRLWGQKMDS